VKATATNNGANVTLDLTIPRGDPGTSGSNGTNGTSVTLSDATPANLGTAAAGNSNLGARADHVHSLPVINYANLSNLPTNFPTNTTLVSGLSAGYSGINHAHNYVQSLNNLTGSLTLAAGSSNVTLTANGSTLTIDSRAGLDANAVIDGGDYVGELVYGITFGTQPQSVTTNASLLYTLPFSLPSGSYNRVSYANGTYFATPSSGTTLATSPDCVTWTARQSAFATSGDWTEVVYGNGVYVAYARYTKRYARSTNGISWSEAELTFTSQFLSDKNISAIVYIDGVGFVAFPVSDAGNSVGTAMQSSDASSWSATYGKGGVTGGSTIAVAGGYVHASGARAQIANGTLSQWSQIGSEVNSGRLLAGFIASGQKVFAWSPNPASTSYRALVGAIDYGGDSTWRFFDAPTAYLRATSAAHSDGKWVFSWAATNVGTSGMYWTDGINSPSAGFMPGGVSFETVPLSSSVVAAYSAGSQTLVTTQDGGQNWSSKSLSGVSPITLLYRSGPSVVHDSGSSRSIVQTDGTATATLTASATATGGSAVSYQWQSSVDAGTTWANVANATSTTLSLSNLTSADNGKRYRAAASATGAATVYSQSATLTVI
jgi:hypothetical protein